MLTTSTRNEEPRKSDGVSSTTIPSGVLALSGPPCEPSQPAHSASCPTTYTTLNMVASTADQNPAALVDDGIGLCASDANIGATSTGRPFVITYLFRLAESECYHPVSVGSPLSCLLS